MEGSANNMVGSKALISQTSVVTELWKCSSPQAGCTHHRHRFPQDLRRQFSCPCGCWPHRWGYHGGSLGAGSQPRCKSWRLVPMSFSAPTPWGAPWSLRSHSGLLWPQRLCTPGWHCTRLHQDLGKGHRLWDRRQQNYWASLMWKT